MLHVIKQAHSSRSRELDSLRRGRGRCRGAFRSIGFASRPSVLREPDGSLAVWYARRRPHYELGFARSTDGVRWERRDQDLRFVDTKEAWEDKERTYPFVFDHGGRRYMLNSNGWPRGF